MKKILLILTVLFLGSLPVYCFANHGLDISMGQSERLQALRDNQVGDNYLQDQLGSIVGVVLSFVGLLFLILLIYAGILWMTASGNDQQVERSRKIIVWALAGLIIVFASFSLVQFLGDRATSSIGTEEEDVVPESDEGSSIE
jgi:cytochrome bd-type quinol oxidase subunit 2